MQIIMQIFHQKMQKWGERICIFQKKVVSLHQISNDDRRGESYGQKLSFQHTIVPLMLGGANDEHPFSIHSASIQHPLCIHCRLQVNCRLTAGRLQKIGRKINTGKQAKLLERLQEPYYVSP